MPSCGCVQGCNCYLSEDGFWAGHPELGRNFTLVNGVGSDADPYSVSFLDQEEFRPRTAEISFPDRSVNNDTYTEVPVGPVPSTITYESPEPFVIRQSNGFHRYSEVNFIIIGAAATFPESAVSTTSRQILLEDVRGGTSPLTASAWIIAGQTVPGAADPLTLSCSVMFPGVFFNIDGVGPLRHQFRIHLYQNSGATMVVSNIKLWITEI